MAFGDIYVSKLQANQKFRYNELMQALNMSAALTARKTREFRSPPQEQVRAPSHSAFLFSWKYLKPTEQAHVIFVVSRAAARAEKTVRPIMAQGDSPCLWR